MSFERCTTVNTTWEELALLPTGKRFPLVRELTMILPDDHTNCIFIARFPNLRTLTIFFKSMTEASTPKIVKPFSFSEIAASCIHLQTLYICGYILQDLKGIDKCRRLSHVGLTFEEFQSLEDINRCSSLRVLELSGTGRDKRITPSVWSHISGAKVTKLILSELDLTELSNDVMKSLSQLQEVDIQNCYNVPNLLFLQNVPLTRLKCEYSELESLEGICLDNLEKLYLKFNQLRTCDPLLNAHKLRTLYICGNNITSIETLRQLDLDKLVCHNALDFNRGNEDRCDH